MEVLRQVPHLLPVPETRKISYNIIVLSSCSICLLVSYTYCIYTRLLSLKLKKLLEMEEEMVPVFHLSQPVAELQKNHRGEIGRHCVAATSINWHNMMNRKQYTGSEQGRQNHQSGVHNPSCPKLWVGSLSTKH